MVTAVIERAREDTQSKEQFVASLRGRIHSMASAQALLSESRWRGVNLTSLIRAELAPYATATNTNLDGPTIHLRPEATHAVAMVMHELATNAAKYGALSQPDGQVSVRWRLAAKPPAGSVLDIQWEETGGPAVTGPERQGYDSRVVRDLLSYELARSISSLRLLGFAAASNCPHGRSLKRSADLAVAVVQRESCDDACRLCWGIVAGDGACAMPRPLRCEPANSALAARFGPPRKVISLRARGAYCQRRAHFVKDC